MRGLKILSGDRLLVLAGAESLDRLRGLLAGTP
jgi:hypothetical protein